MKWSLGLKIAGRFAIAVAVLLVFGWAAYGSTSALADASTSALHSQRALEVIAEIFTTLKDAESGERGYVVTGEERYLEPYQGSQSKILERLKELRLIFSSAQQQRAARLEPLVTARFAELQEVVDLRHEKGFGPASRVIVADKGKKIMDDARALIGEMERAERELLAQRMRAVSDHADRAELTSLGGTLVSLVIWIVLGYTLAQSIFRSLGAFAAASPGAPPVSAEAAFEPPKSTRLREAPAPISSPAAAEKRPAAASAVAPIAATELVLEVASQPGADRGPDMQEALKDWTARLHHAAGVVLSSSGEILAFATQAAASAADAAAGLTEAKTGMVQVQTTSQASHEQARVVSENAQQVAQTAEEARRGLEQTIEAMERIQWHVEAVAETVVTLSEEGHAVSQLEAMVGDLAEQANVIAVSAAIEATRAGERGKPFAGIAHEIKALADQSRRAAAQVRAVLTDIQKGIGGAVAAAEQGSKTIDVAVRQSETVRDAFRFLSETSQVGAQAAAYIATSSQRQFADMDQMAVAVETIRQTSLRNVTRIRQAETSARALHEIGKELKELVDLYRV